MADTEHSVAPAAAIPDVSVVIVSWNVANLLVGCLDSLVRCADGLALEVWVVDNASSDNSVELVRSRYPWVHLIANEDNRGFARANNQAIRQARGRFVLILNPDTVVQAGALGGLYRFLAEHGEVGMVGPRLVDGNGEIWEMCARRLFTMSTAFWFEGLCVHGVPRLGRWALRRLWTPYDFEVTQEVECLSGAAMLVRRELLQDLQGFGEMFQHCGEDLDLCFRTRAAGWKIYYDANATIVHLIGRSEEQDESRCHIDSILGNEEYLVRCYGRLHGRLYRLMNRCVCLPRVLVVGIVKSLAGAQSRAAWLERLKVARFLCRWKKPT